MPIGILDGDTTGVPAGPYLRSLMQAPAPQSRRIQHVVLQRFSIQPPQARPRFGRRVRRRPTRHLWIAAAQDASPAADGGTPEDQLEIFSWWTTAGEAAGLDELFKAFSASYPDVEIINAAVAGGAGTNAQVALQTRLSAGEPPDSWQSHPGAELKARYVDPGYTEPVTALWDEQGWREVFPQGVIDQITFDDEIHLVPVGVHRGNVMFYNKQVLADNGIEVTDDWTMDDYNAAAETLQAAGVAALGLGSKDTFAVVQLFENTLLASLGPDDFTKVWTGEVGWDDERVTAAIEQLATYFDSVNGDHAALTWDGAADAVYAGTAAFTSMGDWLYGDAVAKEQQDAIGWVNHPGTGGSFVAVIDGFTMPSRRTASGEREELADRGRFCRSAGGVCTVQGRDSGPQRCRRQQLQRVHAVVGRRRSAPIRWCHRWPTVARPPRSSRRQSTKQSSPSWSISMSPRSRMRSSQPRPTRRSRRNPPGGLHDLLPNPNTSGVYSRRSVSA